MKNSAKESSEKLKILVAEENQEACSALEELLKVLGHSVMVTQDGEDALDMFHETTPDLVFSGFCLLYTSPSPRDATLSRMPSSA